MPRLIAHPRDPVIIDRKLDVFYAAFWFLLGLWGTLATIKGLPTVQQQFGLLYAVVWPIAISILSFIACGAVLSFFFRTRFAQTTKKRAERTLCYAIGLIIAVYPVALTISGNFASAVLTCAILLIPAYRITVLTDRIKQYES